MAKTLAEDPDFADLLAPPAAVATVPSGDLAKDPMFAADVAAAKQNVSHRIGYSPELALPESPLSPVERAAFGWEKYPDKQQKYLEEHFGKGNVSFEKMDASGGKNFVVKDHGVWKQIDPAGLSDMAGDVLSGDMEGAKKIWKQVSIGNTLGGAAQFLGERGMAVAGATAGAAEMAPLGAPAGPLGVAAMGIVGGAAGAGLFEGAEAGVRGMLQLASDMTGIDIPGSKYVNPEELNQQVMTSMILGATQEGAGMVLRGGGEAFGAALSKIGDTPQAKYALSKLLKMGAKDITDTEARIWADQPSGVSKWYRTAKDDLVNNTKNLYKSMSSKLEGWLESAEEGRKSLGKDYDALETRAKDARFDPFAAGQNNEPPEFVTQYRRLFDEGFVDGKGNIAQNSAVGDLERNLSDIDKKYIKIVKQNFEALTKKGSDATYQDMLRMKQNLNDALYSKESVNNGKLNNIMTGMRTAIDQQMSNGLHEVDPALAQEFMALNQTYSQVAETLSDINKKTDGSKIDTFMKRMLKDDSTGYQHDLVNTMSQALDLENPTTELIQMGIAQKTVPMFVRGRIGAMGRVAGVPVPTPTGGQIMRTGQMIGNAVASPVTEQAAASATGQGMAQKYISKAHEMYKSMPAETRASMIRNPQAIDQMGQGIKGAMQMEDSQTKQLLDQVGSLQEQIYGR